MRQVPAATVDRHAEGRSMLRPVEAAIHAEEVALLYRNAGVSQLVVLVAAPVLAAAVWRTASPATIVVWLVVMIAITAARLQLFAAFRRAAPGPAEVDAWRNRFVVGVACSGASWGAAAIVLLPGAQPGGQFVVAFTLAGMVTAAVPTLAVVPTAFHLFCGLALAPLAFRFLNGRDHTEMAIGVLVLLFMLGMAGIARRIHASLRSTLELRHQNRALVDVLTRANTDAEAINAKLVLEIAEHRRTGGNLEKSLSLLRATLESTNDGILVVDREGRIVSHNQRFLDMWRLPATALASGEADALFEEMRTQLADPEAFIARGRELLTSDGCECHDIVELVDGRVFERYSMPQRIAGAVVGRVCSYHDVTERRHAERNLEFIANHCCPVKRASA
jgi:PAS domain S-box-containing protein